MNQSSSPLSRTEATDSTTTKNHPRKRPPPPNADAPSGSVNKKVKKKNMDPAILGFRKTIQQCCAANNLTKAMNAYEEAVANGTRIEPQSFYNLLNLCDGLGSRGIHIGTPKPLTKASTNDKNDTETTVPGALLTSTATNNSDEAIDVSTRLEYAERIKAHMDTLHLPLTETAYSALVKLYCKVQNTDKAEELLTQAEQVQQCKPKLRLYAPLLTTFCEMGKLTQALQIWQRLSQRDLLLSEKEYAALMKCCLFTGNAVVMERVLSDLAEDVLVPSRATCQVICEWFQSPFAVITAQPPQQQETIASLSKDKNSNDDDDDETISQLLQHIQLPYSEQASSMGPVQCKGECHWTISHNVGIEQGQLQSGCLQGESLQPVALSATAHQTMKEMNETIVLTGKLDQDTSAFQGGKKGPKRPLQDNHLETRKRHWQAFDDYLARRKYKIDVVIDGANVGYYEQNFAGAPKHVDYVQIDWIVQHFVQQGKCILLILHNRHFTRGQLPRSAEAVVQKWNHVLYRTPPGMNDDWFWLHAALKSASSDTVLVVTNDEMRDHHFQMLAPRSFLRWKDRHQVHFSFGDWERNNVTGRKQRKVLLTYPESYSRRIQRLGDGLAIPLAMKGDENRFLDGSFVAEDEDTPEEETYLCIRPVPRIHDAKKE